MHWSTVPEGWSSIALIRQLHTCTYTYMHINIHITLMHNASSTHAFVHEGLCTCTYIYLLLYPSIFKPLLLLGAKDITTSTHLLHSFFLPSTYASQIIRGKTLGVIITPLDTDTGNFSSSNRSISLYKSSDGDKRGLKASMTNRTAMTTLKTYHDPDKFTSFLRSIIFKPLQCEA